MSLSLPLKESLKRWESFLGLIQGSSCSQFFCPLPELVAFLINHIRLSESVSHISDLICVVALKRAGWFRIICDESVLRPWQLSRTSWGGGQPGCWGGLHPGQW